MLRDFPAGGKRVGRGIVMADSIGKPENELAQEESSSRLTEACRRLGELSSDTLRQIEEIEANARVAERKSGSIVLR